MMAATMKMLAALALVALAHGADWSDADVRFRAPPSTAPLLCLCAKNK